MGAESYQKTTARRGCDEAGTSARTWNVGPVDEDVARTPARPGRGLGPDGGLAVGLGLARADAPTLFTRSTSNLGDQLAILFIIMTPCVVLGMMSLLGMRVLLARLRWRPPARLGMSLLALGISLVVASGLMGLVMRAVVGLAE